MAAPTEGTAPDGESDSIAERPSGYISPLSVMYGGLVVLLLAYLGTVRLLETRLEAIFQDRIDDAIEVTSFDRPVILQMKDRIEAAAEESAWVRWGGLRLTTVVLARDGVTWLYVVGQSAPVDPDRMAPTDLLSGWVDYLPAKARVSATLPHNAPLSLAILLCYASLLALAIYAAHRRASHLESQRLGQALESRDEAALRAREIAAELDKTRSRLSEVEPKERERREEIESLQSERETLQRKLTELAAREETLRSGAHRALELTQEVRALEDLLEEATGDLELKDEAIQRLERHLKRATRSADRNAGRSGRTRAAEQLARRFRTLYKNIEIDDRAIDDIASLGDESLRLKAEESIKRLADEAENVAVRRKVGGLPDHVHVYELGFAGKGRIYYARGRTRRFRVLLVGAKNTQPTDMEYLARLPREDVP